MSHDPSQFRAKTDALCALMEKHMGITAADFEAAVARAGRRLPRAIRGQARVIVEAAAIAEHPRLSKQIDEKAFKRAHRLVADHLASLDLKDERHGRRINVAAAVAFNILALLVLALVVLRWRGFL